jgi:hypothetical protein
VQFNEEQTRPALSTDYNSLELELDKRFSNKWSGRVSYTLSHCNDVVAPLGIVGASDTDPRLDYGRCARDNRHAFAVSTNVQPWKGLAAASSSAATPAIRSTRPRASTPMPTAPTTIGR